MHVNLPRITRVARALGLDFAPALVGFEYQRGGKTLPVFEGVVVCEEFEVQLTTAYVVGLYKLTAVDPWLESAWFQPLSLPLDPS